MDPLTLLKEFYKQGHLDEVEQQGARINFGDRYSFAKNIQTGFKSQLGKGDFYPLDAILFALKNKDASYAAYVTAAKQNNVPNVIQIERKKLYDWMDGTVDHVPEIMQAPEQVPLTGMTTVEEAEPAAKRPRTEGVKEVSALKSLHSQERQLRNRNTMLVAPNRTFENVLKIVADVADAMRKQQVRELQMKKAAQASAAFQPKPSERHKRDATGEQLRAMGAENLNISMYGTSRSHKQQPAHAPASAPKPSSAPSSSAHHSGQHRSSGSAAPGSNSNSNAKSVPLILVPAAMTAMINMHNVRQFLEEGKYVPAQQAQAEAQQEGREKPEVLTFKRTAQRTTPVTYQVTDKPPKKGSPDWDRVVAVIVQGAKWQFKEFPFRGAADGELTDTFTRICGFFLHYADEKPSELVKGWAVNRLVVDRQARHRDRTVMLEFFKNVDSFMKSKRSSVVY